MLRFLAGFLLGALLTFYLAATHPNAVANAGDWLSTHIGGAAR